MKIPGTHWHVTLRRDAPGDPPEAARQPDEHRRPLRNRAPGPPGCMRPRQALPPRQDRLPPAAVSYDVPDFRQTRLNACGDACMNVMLAFHGMRHVTSGTNDRRVFQGLVDLDLALLIEAHGLQVTFLEPARDGDITGEELHRWLRTHGPLICGSRDHFFVVTGVCDDEVTIHCPLLGRRQGSIDALNSYIDWRQTQPPILATAPAGHSSQVAEEAPGPDAQRHGATPGPATRLLAFIEKRSTPQWKKPG